MKKADWIKNLAIKDWCKNEFLLITTKTIPVHWNISEFAFGQEKKKIIKNVVKTTRETFSKMSLFAAVFIFGGMNDLEER